MNGIHRALLVLMAALLLLVMGASAQPAHEIVFQDGCALYVKMPVDGAGSWTGWRLTAVKTGLNDGQTVLKCIYLSPEYNQNPPPDDAYEAGCRPFVMAAEGGAHWQLWLVKYGQYGREGALRCIYRSVESYARAGKD